MTIWCQAADNVHYFRKTMTLENLEQICKANGGEGIGNLVSGDLALVGREQKRLYSYYKGTARDYLKKFDTNQEAIC